MNITGTTLTGCTLGPYYDPNALYGFVDNQVLTYSPVTTINSTTNNQVLTYSPVTTINSTTNNQVLTYSPVTTINSTTNNQVITTAGGA